MNEQNSQFLTEKIKRRYEEILLVLLVAIIFSFFMGIVANITFSYVKEGTIGQNVLILLILSIIGSILSAYRLYHYYVLKENLVIKKEIVIPIIFNRSEGLIIDDPFDGDYYPQKMAWQLFNKIIKEKPELKDKLKKGMSLETKEKHIITELLEYIIILTLSKDLRGFGEKGLMPDKNVKNLPKELGANTFYSFFRRLKPTDIFDKGMSQLDFELPKDMKIKYWSPAPIKDYLPDPNTFKIGLTGKYCEVYLTVRYTSYWPIQSMMCGPAPALEGAYINPYFQNEVSDNVGKSKLIRMTFHLNIEAKFKLRGMLFPPKGYMNWAEKWINGFICGKFTGFDFNQVKLNQMKEIQYKTYETVEMNQKWIENIENEVRKIRDEMEKEKF
ncbi:MAG: hypothetical protein A7315_10430 [Candidatus Altiarchaeales archaeon WOR_SM1_79]|nr:MAG: hypothetical protein A7315_10430 [Candidatus Altiarchaeales archaeon WOR_SM1_79]